MSEPLTPAEQAQAHARLEIGGYGPIRVHSEGEHALEISVEIGGRWLPVIRVFVERIGGQIHHTVYPLGILAMTRPQPDAMLALALPQSDEPMPCPGYWSVWTRWPWKDDWKLDSQYRTPEKAAARREALLDRHFTLQVEIRPGPRVAPAAPAAPANCKETKRRRG